MSSTGLKRAGTDMGDLRFSDCIGGSLVAAAPEPVERVLTHYELLTLPAEVIGNRMVKRASLCGRGYSRDIFRRFSNAPDHER
jgi:hypothetical protein